MYKIATFFGEVKSLAHLCGEITQRTFYNPHRRAMEAG